MEANKLTIEWYVDPLIALSLEFVRLTARFGESDAIKVVRHGSWCA